MRIQTLGNHVDWMRASAGSGDWTIPHHKLFYYLSSASEDVEIDLYRSVSIVWAPISVGPRLRSI